MDKSSSFLSDSFNKPLANTKAGFAWADLDDKLLMKFRGSWRCDLMIILHHDSAKFHLCPANVFEVHLEVNIVDFKFNAPCFKTRGTS